MLVSAFLKIKKSNEIWASMKYVGSSIGVKNIFDLVFKKIYGIYEKRELTKEEIKNYKMAEREIYEDYLSEDGLNETNNKNIYVRDEVMANIIKHCRGEKQRGIRAIDGFRKKLTIPDYKISKCPEHEVKAKIGNIFVNEKILEEYSVKIYDIEPYFYEHYNEKIQTDKNDREYILFRIDIHFTEYFLAVEIDEKSHTDKDLIFEEKRQKALEKRLNCEFIRINTSREKIMVQAVIEYRRLSVHIYVYQYIYTDKEKENEIKEKEN